MAITIKTKHDAERGAYYEVDLSANGDTVQAHLRSDRFHRLEWLEGRVGWHKSASVTVTFTSAGDDAMAITAGNGELDGWVAHPDDANTQSVETLPITGLRFAATAASQKVLLYTSNPLDVGPVDAGTPA